jgi:hypothetical protein
VLDEARTASTGYAIGDRFADISWAGAHKKRAPAGAPFSLLR